VLLFKCLTYISREITTATETATATKAKDVNSEVMLLPVELVSVGVEFELWGMVIVWVLLQTLVTPSKPYIVWLLNLNGISFPTRAST